MAALRTFSTAVLVGIGCLLLQPHPLRAQGIPPEAYRAKTIFIRNNAGGAPLENAADEELSKWGRFTLADDEASADIVLVFSGNGVTNTERARTRRTAPAAIRAMARDFHWAQRCAYLKGHGARAGVAAILAKRMWRNDAEGERQRMH